MKNFYTSPCMCLQHEVHLERRFIIRTPFHFEHYVFYFCNSYLKLKFTEYLINKGSYYGRSYDFKWMLRDLITSKIDFKNYNDISSFIKPKRDKFSHSFSFHICERPYLFLSYSIKNACDIILDNCMSRDFIETFSQHVARCFSDYEDKYSKSKYKKVHLLVKKLDRYMYQYEEQKMIVFDIANEIMNIKIIDKQ